MCQCTYIHAIHDINEEVIIHRKDIITKSFSSAIQHDIIQNEVQNDQSFLRNATPVIGARSWMYFLLMLISEKAEQTAYHILVKLPTISYYTALNWRHYSFCSYTILLRWCVFQKKAFGITNIPSLSSSWLVLVAGWFVSAGTIHTQLGWTSSTAKQQNISRAHKIPDTHSTSLTS